MMMQFFQQRERKLKRIQADDPINFLQLMNKADIGAGEVGGRGLLIMGLTAVGEHQELEHEDHILKHHVFCSYLCFLFIFRTSLS